MIKASYTYARLCADLSEVVTRRSGSTWIFLFHRKSMRMTANDDGWCNDDTDKGDYIGQWTDVRPNWETALVGLLTWCNVVWYNSAP